MFYKDYKILGELNFNIFDFTQETNDLKINLYDYNINNTQTTSVMCISAKSNMGSYNFIVKPLIENNKFILIPIYYWGINKLFTNQGFVYPPVYKEIDENGDEKEIAPEELQKQLDKINGIELNCISDCFYRNDKDSGKVSMTAKELEEFLQEYYYN